MSNRHLARTIAMQSLYEWDFLGRPETVSVESLVERHRQEFAPDFEDGGFIKELVEGVVTRQGEIDEMLSTFAPLENMAIVDRNILRIALFELLHMDSVPSKVSINEAIEIAKSFGGQASGKFVNGVLGAIYKDRQSKGLLKVIDLTEIPPTNPSSAVPSLSDRVSTDNLSEIDALV